VVIRSAQLSLFDDAPPRPALPAGMAYVPDLIGPKEERALAEHLEALPFEPFQFRGYEGRRKVAYFGWSYDFSAGRAAPADPLPAYLEPLRARAAAFAGLPVEALQQCLINRYEPEAGVGWHRDRPVFGEVVGVSLLAPALFRMRRREGDRWTRVNLTVEPRSAYVLRGQAREQWEHSVPPVDALRYSVTFRTLRTAPAGS
jgi:alkylated DNA repair dioxygenase AlkB